MDTGAVALIGLAIQFVSLLGALIWGAATIKSTVTNVNSVVKDLKDTMETIRVELKDHHARLSVLESNMVRLITWAEKGIGGVHG